MTGDEIRKAFLRFFEGKGHTILPSSPLIPQGDPTLLLTTAGMVQIKPYFLGLAIPPNVRLASCQKCFRTTDIDSVGDNKHLTFFEMLGNFSVGDYFKKEAIDWAWEFVTRWLKLPPERLWITIFLDDEEAFNCWREIGVPTERIVRLGEKDNFWGPAGDSGPCGPCSEIHWDFGVEFGCGKPDCGPGCDCSRFSEIWNLVFTQHNQDKEGKRTPLPRPNIDTGMGLERVAAVMQGRISVYETDLFDPIVKRVAELAGKPYGQDEAVDRAIRIVAEHARGITFLIADGVFPSNEGRGYVLRRVLRRASLFGRKLGMEKPFLTKVANIVIAEMGHLYPELVSNQDFILRVMDLEEERFEQTLEAGLNSVTEILEKATEEVRTFVVSPAFISLVQQRDEVIQQIQKIQRMMPNPALLQAIEQYQKVVQQIPLQAIQQFQKAAQQIPLQAIEQYQNVIQQIPLQTIQQFQKVAQQIQRMMPNPVLSQTIQQMQPFITLPAREVFRLYDTYGFPKELTEEMATEKDFSVDSEGFEQEMERQRERARTAQKISPVGILSSAHVGTPTISVSSSHSTEFVGYKTLKHESTIVVLLSDSESVEKGQVESVSEGQDVGVILHETPFYGEMGGQVGDTGEIRSRKGRVAVVNTIKRTVGTSERTIHQGKVIEGSLSGNDVVEAEVDVPRRLDIARNHTATHLLQTALRKVLGEHVHQAGSLVAPDRLRFDFSQLVAINKEQLAEIQFLVNERIRENLPVIVAEIPYSEALSRGAIALFGEKYGDVVRMVQIGEPPRSIELCGGTHVKSTQEIGLFHILSESSIGSGARRIEAVTGRGAGKFFEERLSALETAAQQLQTTPQQVPEKVLALLQELDKEQKRASDLERELARKIADSLLPQAKQVKSVVGIDINVISAKVPVSSSEAMREIGDRLKEKLVSGVIVLGAIYNDRPNFMTMVTPDLVAEGLHAGEMVKQIAKVAGGGGGGRAELGQGSGKDKNKLDEALSRHEPIIAHFDRDSGTLKKRVD